MIMVWRLARPDSAAELNGEGNTITGARWNSPGRGVVYTSFNLSLCVLESFVHLPPVLRINLPEMAAVRIEVPDEAYGLNIGRTELPSNLAGEEAEKRYRQLGDGWLAAREHLVCTVPSIIVPQERNLMLNPVHPLIAKVRIVSIEPFRFDPRLATARG
jgi:RES domain-containing protein